MPITSPYTAAAKVIIVNVVFIVFVLFPLSFFLFKCNFLFTKVVFDSRVKPNSKSNWCSLTSADATCNNSVCKLTQNIRISTHLYKGIFCKTIEKLFCSGFINIIYTYIYSCVAKQVSRRIKVHETNAQAPTSANGFAAAKGGNSYL